MMSGPSPDAVADFEGMTARDAQAALARALGAVGIEDPGRDARLLVAASLGAATEDLLKEPARRIERQAAEKLAAFAGRRLAREPVSRILGERAFFGRVFHITPATLDPRPCTETVIEAALEIAENAGWKDRPIRVLDVGTGSGVLLVTLLAELPHAVGVGTDVSDEVLAVAHVNAVRLGVASRATFLKRRNLDGVPGPFDLMVSNPPYIPRGDIESLAPEVRAYDPVEALDGGADGLGIYRALSRALADAVPQGWAFFEVGAGQAEAVQDILRENLGSAVAELRTWQDLGRHERCVAVRTQNYS